jgi:hypothetical protein
MFHNCAVIVASFLPATRFQRAISRGITENPLNHASAPAFHLVRTCSFPRSNGFAAADPTTAHGELMLDERMTLTILSWTVGTVCIGTLVLSALSLQ